MLYIENINIHNIYLNDVKKVQSVLDSIIESQETREKYARRKQENTRNMCKLIINAGNKYEYSTYALLTENEIQLIFADINGDINKDYVITDIDGENIEIGNISELIEMETETEF